MYFKLAQSFCFIRTQCVDWYTSCSRSYPFIFLLLKAKKKLIHCHWITHTHTRRKKADTQKPKRLLPRSSEREMEMEKSRFIVNHKTPIQCSWLGHEWTYKVTHWDPHERWMSFNRNFVVVWLIHCSLPFLSFSSISCVCVCCVYFWAAWHGFGCVRHQFCCNYIAAAVKTIANCCTPIDTHLPVFPELQARKKNAIELSQFIALNRVSFALRCIQEFVLLINAAWPNQMECMNMTKKWPNWSGTESSKQNKQMWK